VWEPEGVERERRKYRRGKDERDGGSDTTTNLEVERGEVTPKTATRSRKRISGTWL
jgi:hypothetical protein